MNDFPLTKIQRNAKEYALLPCSKLTYGELSLIENPICDADSGCVMFKCGPEDTQNSDLIVAMIFKALDAERVMKR